MNINDVEKKLIIELQKNGRISYAKLARLVGINVSTAKKRVERLLKTNTIMIRAARYPSEMRHIASAFIAIDVELSKINDVCSKLVKNFYIGVIVTTFGQSDVFIIASYPSWEMLHNFIKSELSPMDGVQKIDPFFVKENKKISFKDKYVFSNVNDFQPLIMDEVDFKLIEELAKDGRASCVSLSNRLGINKSTVSRRISSLIKRNIISVRAIPNPSALGYLLDAFIFIKAEPTAVEDICDRLVKYDEVYLIITLINGYDVLVGANFPSPEILDTFITREIAQAKGILDIETYIRAQVKKMDYSNFLLQE